MDFIYKYRRLIVAFLAVVLIVMGLVQGLTGKTFNTEVTKWIEYIVMFGAVYLLLVLPRQYSAKAEAEAKESDAHTEENAAKEDVSNSEPEEVKED